MTCPSCGTQAPAEARFCPACGHTLAAQADQRRVVTVVFADLVGFTGLSEVRDPEQVKNLVDRCFERLATDVTAFGGKVDKVVGDALVALFGAPVAHEDDAERAVRAALEMQRTVEAFADDIGVEVKVRIGVNTGEVLVGGMRAGDDYTAMGDVVNVASRLQASARPGQVVVGPQTHAATEAVVSYDEMGEVELRGRDEAVPVWVAREAVAPPGYRPRRVRTPLLGRDAEIGVLRYAVRSAVERRRPAMALVTGEAGIGKSRLAEELAIMARTEHDAVMWVGRCVPYGEANPWWPVSEILRQAFAIELSDSLEDAERKAERGVETATRRSGPEARRLVEGLLYLMGFEDALAEVDPNRATEEAIAALAEVVEGVALRHPVILFIADLHWADQAVLDLVDELVERLRGLPVVVFGTARPELEDRWTPTAPRANLISIHLDPLDAGATEELAAALLGRAVPTELVDALRGRSGGNPFFLEELVALLHESGALEGEDLDVTALPGQLGDLPATLRGLVAARLDGLGAAERGLVEDAAVIGRVGSTAALVGLGEARGERDVAGPLDDLMVRELLVVGDGNFEFKSDLVREVAYETLTKSARARRHAALAEWLSARARRTGREDEHLEQIAHHFAVAAELTSEVGAIEGAPADLRTRALDWLRRAAERAVERDSNLVAEQFFDTAVGLLGEEEDDLRQALLLGRARARTGRHDLPGARADLAEVLAKAGDERRVRALTVLGEVQQKAGDMEGALDNLEQAMNLANETGNRQGLAEALRQWGMAHLFLGELDRAESAIAEARDAFRTLGDRRSEAWALQNLAWIAFTAGDSDLADERLTESAAMFEEINDWGGRSWAHGLLGFVRLTQGRLEEAGELADSVLPEARKAGDRWALGMTLVLQSSVALWLGRTNAALESAEEARRTFTAIDDWYGRSLALANLTRAGADVGRIAEARANLEEAVLAFGHQGDAMAPLAMNLNAAVLGQLGDARGALAAVTEVDVDASEIPSELFVSKALALLQSGQADAALPYLDRVLNPDAPRIGPGDEGARTFAMAVDALALAAVGAVESAVEVGTAVEGRALGTYLDETYADLGVGLAHAQVGRGDEARRVFDRARIRIDATEDRLTQAVVRLARARGLRQLGDEGADEALAEARHRFDVLGVEPYGWETAFDAAATGGVSETTGPG